MTMATPSKNRQRLPDTSDLEELHDQIEAALEDVEAAYTTVMNSVDVRELAGAYAQLKALVDQWNECCFDAYNDIDAYFSERSERWLASARGQAVEAWQEALERARMNPDPTGPVYLTIEIVGGQPSVGLETDPAEVLPELPDIPALDETA
jgi:hypothetical protein